MNIRPYRAEDWERLCAIHDAARMEELQAAGMPDAFLPLPIAAEREGLFDYRVQVAESDGQVLGFVADDGSELAWLYVDPSARRRGIGQALVAAVQAAQPAGLALELLEGNAAALAFYRACGFIETGMQRGRMPGNETFAVRVQCMRWAGALD
ncbi:GNAT family N-acetyltransferase [Pseudoxanthomonas composti]|uniref:GNAT family N-acetyltransferase n=1 Tax=Pseudoxanthomonas composti TaxID=2137479 RepID=A0A4Q1JZ66_9GAMM|nr:GNAT family N-acetyltransferase [Pseudoxanthomonas composti]RXR08379.1 GNAT family N-acetyltransferase [Pseudoxanthomonas composti]